MATASCGTVLGVNIASKCMQQAMMEALAVEHSDHQILLLSSV